MAIDINHKRIWLNDIGVFEIIPNPGEGECLFHAIAQALGHPEEHLRIRNAIVKHLMRKSSKLWESLRSSILDFWKYSHKLPADLEHLLETTTQEKQHTCCGFRKPRKSTDHFKRIYSQVMSQPGEPGTVYELRASANLYGFHFDYLDTISPESPTPSTSTLSDADSDDNGNGFVVCHGKTYQFYSCRNNGCKIPREDGHLPCPRNLYLLYTRYSAFQGHWELLKPIYLRLFPVPLHRKIYGVMYPWPSIISFEQHYGLDGFALQIEAQVKSDPMMVPQEDPDWPAYDGDNFAGCLSHFNNLVLSEGRNTTANAKERTKLPRLVRLTMIILGFFRRRKVGGDRIVEQID